MTITPLLPAASRLDRDLSAAERLLARLRLASPLAGPAATTCTRISIRVHTPAEVDALAAELGTRPRWTASGTQYTAETGTLACGAVAEITWFRPDTAGAAA